MQANARQRLFATLCVVAFIFAQAGCSENDMSITAYHEAGHAIATLALGGTVTYITIQPNGNDLGYCNCTSGLADRMAMIYAAGKVSETMFFTDPDSYGSTHDLTEAKRLAHQSRIPLETIVQRTRYLLNSPSRLRAIEMLAKELLRTSYVSGSRAAQIFRKAQSGYLPHQEAHPEAHQEASADLWVDDGIRIAQTSFRHLRSVQIKSEF